MFAVLHVADFALQAIMRRENFPAAQPVALIDDRGRASAVLMANPAAQLAGVAPGQSAPQAMVRCTRLVFRSPRPAAEQDAQAALLAAAFSLSPLVENTSPGVITAQLSALPAARREPAVRHALQCLESLGFIATAGLGRTPLLALYAARIATPFFNAGDDHTFLAPLPLAFADPSPGVVDVLASWGIRKLGQLTALNKTDVAQRLGPNGLALWERAAGGALRPLHAATLPRDFSATVECEHELETLEPLLFILRRSLDRLTLELANAGLVAAELTLGLLMGDAAAHTHTIRLPEPTGDAETLFRTLHTYLEDVRTNSAVTGFRLNVTPTRPLARQHGLFDRALRDPHGFAETLARVAALVGAENVGTPELWDTHQPDAVRLVAPAPVIPPREEKFYHPPRGLALRRFRPPFPAMVELNGPQPAYVRSAPVAGAVNALRGPWFASGGWWESGRDWQREEWDVELVPAGLYRLLRTPDGWFLEGEYD